MPAEAIAVLLTNYPLDNYKTELEEYDFQLNKSELANISKMQELTAKIKRACGNRQENKDLAFMDTQNRNLQEDIIYLPIYKKPWQIAENLNISVPIGYNTVIVKGLDLREESGSSKDVFAGFSEQ